VTGPPLPVSIVIPTIGRRALLERCLRSILACQPRADEVIVVDQSSGVEVESLIDELGSSSIRRIACAGTGIARAVNDGLEAARHDTVLGTHDDCTVAPDWVDTGLQLARVHPAAIITGRVMPPDGSRYVPSTKTDPQPKDFTGTLTSGVLYPANMVVSRTAIRAIGGFDERPSFRVAAEDNDLCYRWLAAGHALRYQPELVVWHHDWRTPDQLVRTHVGYARAQGAFYAKHLHARDYRVLRLLRWDLRHGLRSLIRVTLRHRERWEEPYREMVVSLLAGLVAGWREARARDRRHHLRSASRP
jgi:GT2 family glycosyltransferase